MNLVKELKKVQLFEGLDEDQRGALADIATERSLSQGEELFREGDFGEEMYVILLGSVKIEKTTDKGVAEQIAVLGSGSCFGEIALVVEQRKRTASATAVEKTFVLGFTQKELDRICSEDTSLGYAFYRALSRGLGERLSFSSDQMAYFKAKALHHGGASD